MMTIRDTLQKASKHLVLFPTAHLDSELLLAHALKKSREYLLMHADEEVPKEKQVIFDESLGQRLTGKPIAYLIHEKEFYGRKFYVDKRVLIPRPETELMVELALNHATSNQQPATILDVGTGSGCIAITMALERPDCEVIGLDISKDALEVAKKNAKRLGCENVKFIESDLLLSLRAQRSNLVILANLPYIGTETNRFISEETERFEPHLATFAGPDGLELYRHLWKQIKELKLNFSALFMEIGFSQAEVMTKEIKKYFPDFHMEIKNDLAGLSRLAILLAK